MIHENMPKLGIMETYSIPNNADLEAIDNIPDNEVETKLEFTISTFQLKLMKSCYQKIHGSDNHSVSQLLNQISIYFLRNLILSVFDTGNVSLNNSLFFLLIFTTDLSKRSMFFIFL
mgnify:CR=1 FL=1